MFTRCKVFLGILICFSFACPALAQTGEKDEVFLKNGTSFSGKIKKQKTGEFVIIETAEGKFETIPWEFIERTVYHAPKKEEEKDDSPPPPEPSEPVKPVVVPSYRQPGNYETEKEPAPPEANETVAISVGLVPGHGFGFNGSFFHPVTTFGLHFGAGLEGTRHDKDLGLGAPLGIQWFFRGLKPGNTAEPYAGVFLLPGYVNGGGGGEVGVGFHSALGLALKVTDSFGFLLEFPVTGHNAFYSSGSSGSIIHYQLRAGIVL